MKKDGKPKDNACSVVEEVLAETADMPDIPRDFDEMSSEDWTALNKWVRDVLKSSA
jgi:hypothetical protein